MPIPIEILKKVTVVYTHKSCPDGMASAMILRDAFRMLGTNPRIEFLVHNTPEHRDAGVLPVEEIRAGNYALFCDIAPQSWRKADALMVVLDHHKGAEDIVRSFGELGVFADEKLEPGVSGAVLAFREVWTIADLRREDARRDVGAAPVTVREVKDFAECVGARDTWQTKDPKFQRGQWISKMLMSKPASWWLGGYERVGAPMEARASMVRYPFPCLSEVEVRAGRALFEAHEEAVRQAVEQCVHSFVDSYGLFVFQEQASGFRLCSDVAEAIRNDQTKPLAPKHGRVVAGFSYVVQTPGESPVLLYSLRGLNGFDVAAFAKANGGGGHTAAAGFSASLDAVNEYGSPYDFIRRRLVEFVSP